VVVECDQRRVNRCEGGERGFGDAVVEGGREGGRLRGCTTGWYLSW